MDITLKIVGLVAMSVLIVIMIWGFVLFYKLADDIRKQNMVLYSIIEKLSRNKSKDIDT